MAQACTIVGRFFVFGSGSFPVVSLRCRVPRFIIRSFKTHGGPTRPRRLTDDETAGPPAEEVIHHSRIAMALRGSGIRQLGHACLQAEAMQREATMDKRRTLPILLVTLLASGCVDQSTGPGGAMSAQFAKGGKAACPILADYVVSDEAGLRTALETASPGEVIGIDGMVGISKCRPESSAACHPDGGGVWIYTDSITLTCATEGSGLYSLPANDDQILIWVSASHVTVSDLVVDGSAMQHPEPHHIYVGVSLVGAWEVPSDFVLTRNTVRCSSASCFFSAGAPNVTVEDNEFYAEGPWTGVHLQGYHGPGPDGRMPWPIDGTRVVGNTIITSAPSTWSPRVGGIRVHGGRDVIVAHNRIEGPWANSIAPTNLRSSVIMGNSGSGAQRYGIALYEDIYQRPGMVSTDNVFRANRLSGAGSGGIYVSSACGNTFTGNVLKGNANNLGALFDVETGNNTLRGNGNSEVIDNGHYDCDGDGVVDPNLIAGAKRVAAGPPPHAAVNSTAKAAKSEIH